MPYHIQLLIELSKLDRKLDEFEEDFGDLPQEVSKTEEIYKKKLATVEETTNILNDLRTFVTNANRRLKELDIEEKKKTEKQMKVKNNKEYDAITKEINYIKTERENLNEELKKSKLKEENLVKILEQQKDELKEAETIYKEKKQQYDNIAEDQNEEVNALKKERAKLIKKIDKHFYDEYERIRVSHKDAIVKIKKNSCSGCFSIVPPQKIVEIRNTIEKLFTCENCGRILYTDEIENHE